ncbi:DUF2075 domain-containing protein [Actinocorallia sp. API 0066]|uniref:DUF2075 domain-containing protein n=1 Tax=Actinocorallia sp. API 0066 TaxID=2896846 RepID=UPI001E567FA8|nr:DUF2075 domain-containing protein [Actinocorallia sp. API 0066]MCD0448033.1 DUF2075 domain-containing protein [Actinocorallia sp. API 0066]
MSERIAEHLRLAARRNPGAAERRSWDRSLPVLARDLVDAGLGQVEMLAEYQLPLTSKRADVVLAGVGHDGNDAYVVVELKQWSRAELYEDDPELVLVEGMPGGPKLHPARQVAQYCEYLRDFVGALDGARLDGVAYLHNAEDGDVLDLFGQVVSEEGRLFTKTRRGAFQEYLRKRFAPEPGAAAADRLMDSAIRPSKQLMELGAKEIKEREQFVLLDEQRLAYDLVMHAVRSAQHADAKEVVVVTGGPGSGKSVIALSVLGELYRQGRTALHATGSSAFTTTLRNHVGRGSTRVKALFKYFNSFMAAERNSLDVLICDEAHRLRETSVNRFTRAELRSGRPQIDELISVARVPVFLLDENQVVRPGELGSPAEIRAYAEGRGFRVHDISLDGQFRCGGSAVYEDWVLRLLGLRGDGPSAWPGDDHFRVEVAGSPAELEERLREEQEAGYSARMTAGYCWPWSDPVDGALVPDVRIGDWARPWNVKGDRAVGTAPASPMWATAPGGFGQVGCVYTAQGFEYDWNGVILGPDLVVRGGRFVAVREATKDPVFRKSTPLPDYDRLIRHTYKVLLTRGMMGTVLYSVDEETREFLAGLVGRGWGAS